MSRAADKLRAKNAAIRTAQAEGNPPAPASAVRTNPVRVTVDLPPAEHAALVRWCAETAGELGQARVANQTVLRALVRRLNTDPELAAQVRQEISTD